MSGDHLLAVSSVAVSTVTVIPLNLVVIPAVISGLTPIFLCDL
jgi:hypothetical protein